MTGKWGFPSIKVLRELKPNQHEPILYPRALAFSFIPFELP